MMHRPVVNFFQVASLVMALVAVALLAAIGTMHFAIHGAEVRVPSLKGMTVAEARSQTSGLGLDLEVDNRYYSGDVAPGHILTQSPEPGTVVRREWRVRVSESLGPQKVDVPETVGLDERVAALSLRRVGLERSDIGDVTAFWTDDPTWKLMLVWVPSMNLPLIRLPFFNSKESARAAAAATHRATITPQICFAFITSSPVYSLCYVAFKPGSFLLPGLRRIILRWSLPFANSNPVRIFLEIDGLAGLPAPDQLFSRWVIYVDHQRADGDGRSLARN